MPADSDTPLIRKLGIKPPARILFVNAPVIFAARLGPLPRDVEMLRPNLDEPSELDLAVIFATSEQELQARFPNLAAMLAPAGALWVAWPKKTSGVTTDVVRVAGLDCGLVDNKVCSIDATWSAQRFVVRLKDRAKQSAGKRR